MHRITWSKIQAEKKEAAKRAKIKKALVFLNLIIWPFVYLLIVNLITYGSIYQN